MQILSLVPELVNVFAQVVASPVETSEVKALVGRAFSHLVSLYGQQMQPLLSNLPPAHANALSAFAPRSWSYKQWANWKFCPVFYLLLTKYVYEEMACYKVKVELFGHGAGQRSLPLPGMLLLRNVTNWFPHNTLNRSLSLWSSMHILMLQKFLKPSRLIRLVKAQVLVANL